MMSIIIADIEKALKVLKPEYCRIIDESRQHQGPPERVTHIRMEIVSETFHNQSLLMRHRTIHQILEPWLKNLHAISIYPYTPSEWPGSAPLSPSCKKGLQTEKENHRLK